MYDREERLFSVITAFFIDCCIILNSNNIPNFCFRDTDSSINGE